MLLVAKKLPLLMLDLLARLLFAVYWLLPYAALAALALGGAALIFGELNGRLPPRER